MEDLNQKENQPPDLSGRSSSIGKGNVTDSNVILNMNSTKLGGSTSTCVDSEKIASRSTRVSNIGPGPESEKMVQPPLRASNSSSSKSKEQVQLLQKFRQLRQWQQQQQENMFVQQQQHLEILRCEQDKLQNIIASQKLRYQQTESGHNSVRHTAASSAGVMFQLPQDISGTVFSGPTIVGSHPAVHDSDISGTCTRTEPGSIIPSPSVITGITTKSFREAAAQSGLNQELLPSHSDWGVLSTADNVLVPRPIVSNDAAQYTNDEFRTHPHCAAGLVNHDIATYALTNNASGLVNNELRTHPVLWQSGNYSLPLGMIPHGTGRTVLGDSQTVDAQLPPETVVPFQHYHPAISGPSSMYKLHATPAVSVYSSLDSSATTGATESLRVSLPVPGYHSDVDSQSDHSEADMLSGVYPLRDTASEGSVDDCEVNYVEMQQEAKDAEGSDVAVKQMADSDATLVEEVSEAQNPKKEKNEVLPSHTFEEDRPIQPGIGAGTTSFEDLLEKQLKLEQERTSVSGLSAPRAQKTFLRKGEGLARFGLKPKTTKTQGKQARESLAKPQAPVSISRNTEKGQLADKSHVESRTKPPGSHMRLTLHKVTRKLAGTSAQAISNVTGETKQAYGSSVLASRVIGPFRPAAPSMAINQVLPMTAALIKTSVSPNDTSSQSNNSKELLGFLDTSLSSNLQEKLQEWEQDQELEEEELEEFEMLEEAAANSSLSSNSSVVVRMLAKAKGGGQSSRREIKLAKGKEGVQSSRQEIKLTKAKGGGQSSRDEVKLDPNKPFSAQSAPGPRGALSVPDPDPCGILSPVDTGYSSGDVQVLTPDGTSRQDDDNGHQEYSSENVSTVLHPPDDSDEGEDTVHECSMDDTLVPGATACDLSTLTGYVKNIEPELQSDASKGGQAKIVEPLNEEFDDEETWGEIKEAGTDGSSDDDTDDAISDIHPLVTSTPPYKFYGSPKTGTTLVTGGLAHETVKSSPPTSSLVTKLFPQLKQKEKAAQLIPLVQLAQPANASVGANMNTSTALQSNAVREKLNELDAEIERFRSENAALSRVRVERDEGLARLQNEIAAFEKQKTEELERLEKFTAEEMGKLRREKRLFDKYQKAARAMPDKKERDEMEALQKQINDLQDELKRRETRWSAAAARYRDKIESLERQNKELQEEVKLLEKYRLERWHGEAKDTEEAKPRKALQRKIKSASAAENQISPLSVTRPHPRKAASVESVEKPRQDVSYSPSLRLDVSDSAETTSSEKSQRNRTVHFKVDSEPSTTGQLATTATGQSVKIAFSSSTTTGQSVTRTTTTGQSLTPALTSAALTDQSVTKATTTGQSVKTAHASATTLGQSATTATATGQSVKTVLTLATDVRREQQEIVYPDGKVEKVNSDGSRVIAFSNGTRKEISADGQSVIVTFFNGDMKQVMPDQRLVYYYAEAQTTHTTYPDGLEVLQFPSNQIEKHYPDGTKEIIFPDQTVKYLYASGAEECIFADGTIQRVTPDGERTLEFPNGQREIHTQYFKKREYPDGTVKTVYQDGRTETRYATGRLRVKDREGRILVDTSDQDR